MEAPYAPHALVLSGFTDCEGLGAGDGRYYSQYFSPEVAAQLFTSLSTAWSWIEPMFRGKPMRRKKRAFVMFEADGSYPMYRYPGRFKEVVEFHPTIAAIRATILQREGRDPNDRRLLNHCIATYYRNGNAGIGMHQDKPADIAHGSLIYDISLGVPRMFVLEHNATHIRQVIALQSGSMLAFGAPTNNAWKHALLEDRQCVMPRISLVFRTISTLYNPVTGALVERAINM